ncbi:Thioredoxin, conserved site [Phytophthora cactorum]|nr:Thioredoxin, conserved site [Phytophthora cactorum]
MMFMKQAARAWSCCSPCRLVVRAAEFEEQDDVLVLTESNFAEAVSGHDTLLVEFYAPWCGHCQKLTPEYAAAAKNLKEAGPAHSSCQVDATAESKLAEQFAVRGFPRSSSLRATWSPSRTTMCRTSAEIEKWVVKKGARGDQGSNDVVVFTVIDAEEGEARTLLEKLADADDLAVYVASTSADVTEDAAAVNKVVLYKKFDEGKVVYDGEFEKESLGEFVKGNSLPLVITFSQEKAPMIFGGEMTEHVLAFVERARTTSPAKANKGKLLHVIMPSTEKRIVDYFVPAIMLVNMAGSMKKYGFDYKADDFVAKIEDGLTEDLVAFEKSYFEGKLTPLLKSADPEDDSDEAVKVIVGTEFRSVSGPKYEELAEKFADVDSIMVAKMDATANEIDHPGVDVRGFPTILFFPGKDKQNPVVYEGSRDVEGFTEFLKTNAQKFELDGSEHGAEQEQDEDEDNEEQQQEGRRMEPSTRSWEIAIRVLSTCYAVGIGVMILRLQGEDTSYIMLQVVFTMVFTCPCNLCRSLINTSQLVLSRLRCSAQDGVLPEKKPKKKPDIAVASAKAVQRTQAEILAEQRERVKNLHGVGEKKLKPKAPKRKGPPSKKN